MDRRLVGRRQADAEADADGDVARRVDEHAVAPGRDVERHGRVRAAGPAAPVVDVQLDTLRPVRRIEVKSTPSP